MSLKFNTTKFYLETKATEADRYESVSTGQELHSSVACRLTGPAHSEEQRPSLAPRAASLRGAPMERYLPAAPQCAAALRFIVTGRQFMYTGGETRGGGKPRLFCHTWLGEERVGARRLVGNPPLERPELTVIHLAFRLGAVCRQISARGPSPA